ncbi:MAG: methyltransferase regulatory domain-containing protein, partial [Acidobacteriota bacterium]|nr:methyltransferase regulatory domain-containing protein [Acidobacteriota bacterium]
ESGIGYVSYDCYPGGHLREMVREMMMFHTRNIESPLEKVEAAVSFLDLIGNNTSDQSAYKQVLLAENIRHSKHVPSDFYHDNLSDCYYPSRFSEIAERLERNGLEYLCESDYQSMSPRNLSPSLQEFLKDITCIRELEDYMDFARGRQFRKTLFCRKGSPINRQLTPDRLSKISIASTATPDKPHDVEKESTPVRFASQLGAGIEIDHPVTKMVLTETGKRVGAPVNIDDLLQDVKKDVKVADWDHEEEICRRILLRLIEDTAMLELYSYADEGTGNLPQKPNASPLAKWQIRVGTSVTSRFGSVIGLEDSVAKHLVGLADGSRTVAEIETGIEKFVVAEGIEDEVRSDLDVWVRESIVNLTRIGIINDDKSPGH